MDGQEPYDHINQPQDERVQSTTPTESTADYANYKPPEKTKLVKTPSIKTPKVNFKKFFKIILILAIIAGMAFAAYSLFFKSKPATKSNTTNSNQTAQSQSNDNSIVSTTTKHYESSNFNLAFDYP